MSDSPRTFSGLKALQTFAPGWGNPDLLEKTLVARCELVDRLEQLALDGIQGGALHQRLIVGPRGSGKTHVLRVLHNRLWANEDIRKNTLIIFLLEDEPGIATFLDFLVRLLRAIVRWYPDRTDLIQALEELPDLQPGVQEHRAVNLLLEALGSGRALILMENLGVTFDEKLGFGRRGQQALRDLLQQHRRFIIFAAGQSLVEGVRSRNAPFHNFFHVTHLKRLSREEALEFLLSMAKAYEQPEAIRFLSSPEGRGRVSAIYDFTGGNHRLLVTFYDFLVTESLTQLSKLFLEGLNPLRPYYQEQMRSLSSQQQKIVQYLSLEREPRTVKQIARGCLAPPNSISSQLKDLHDRNLVSRTRRGRESCYEITETLFRIVHQADLEQEGAPVRLFIDFLGAFYTAEELIRRARGYSLLSVRNGNVKDYSLVEEAKFYREAIHIHHPKMEPKIIPMLSFGSDENSFRSFFQELREAGAYRDVINFSNCLGEEKDAFLLHSEAYARQALTIAPDDSHIQEAAGRVFAKAGKDEEALIHFERVIILRPDYSKGWMLAGFALMKLGRLEEAENHYRKAVELDGKNTDAYAGMGIVLESMGKVLEAKEAIELALAHGANPENLYNSRGEERRIRGDFIGAISDFSAALAINPTGVCPNFNLITAKLSLGDMPGATAWVESAFKSATAPEADRGLVVQSIQENLLALFEFAPQPSWSNFLNSYLSSLNSSNLLIALEQALSLAVFALLKAHSRFSKERMELVVECLRKDISGFAEVSVALRFIQVGIAYFKDGDLNAGLQLPREERQMFERELGLAAG